MSADLATYEGYKAFLEANRNPPDMVAEILRGAFPAGPASAAPSRPAVPVQGSLFDLTP